MMMKILCIYFTLLATMKCEEVNHDDLCGLPSCNCMRHVHCEVPRPSGFARGCPLITDVLKLNKNESLRNEVIRIHNTFRNQIASGEVHPFPAADKMHYLAWDELLANTAERNVRQCKLKRDQCSNTRKYSMVGQNLGEYKYSSTMEYELWNMMVGLIGYWFDEYKECDPKYITKYERIREPHIRNFALMMQEEATAFGCSGIRFSRGKFKIFIFTCNYSVNNTLGAPVYTTGSTPAGGCTKKHATYTHLCESSTYVPKTTEKPKTTEAPHTTEKPKTTAAPHTTEEPTTTEENLVAPQ